MAGQPNQATFVINGNQYQVTYQSFEFGKSLGSGSFGIVHQVKHIVSDTLLACKKIDLSKKVGDESKYIESEDGILRQLNGKCTGIVHYYGSFYHDNHLLIFMELMDISLNELNKLVHKSSSVLEERVLGRIFYQVLQALKSMKASSAMHRDIKPDNILLNRSGQVKLCDFGYSKILDDSNVMSSLPGNLNFKAPERLEGDTKNSYDFKSDIWSVGISLLVVAQHKLPFDGSALKIIRTICNGQLGLSRFQLATTLNYSEHLQHFINECLAHSVDDRADYDGLLATEFIRNNKDYDISTFVASWLQTRSQN